MAKWLRYSRQAPVKPLAPAQMTKDEVVSLLVEAALEAANKTNSGHPEDVGPFIEEAVADAAFLLSRLARAGKLEFSVYPGTRDEDWVPVRVGTEEA